MPKLAISVLLILLAAPLQCTRGAPDPQSHHHPAWRNNSRWLATHHQLKKDLQVRAV